MERMDEVRLCKRDPLAREPGASGVDSLKRNSILTKARPCETITAIRNVTWEPRKLSIEVTARRSLNFRYFSDVDALAA